MAKTAVVIPALNEAGNIPKVIRDIQEHLPGADIVVVDDHSEDGTAAAAAAFAGVTVLTSPISLGIGGAVQLGLKYCVAREYDLYIRMDGDGQHKAESLPALLRAAGHATLVQGSRPPAEFAGTSNRVRRLGSSYFRLLFRACASRNIADPTSGFLCFGRDIAEKFARFYPSDFPEIESLVLLLRSGHRVVSAPVTMVPRQGGVSSIGPLYGAIYMFSVTMAFFSSYLRKNPYGAAGASLASPYGHNPHPEPRG